MLYFDERGVSRNLIRAYCGISEATFSDCLAAAVRTFERIGGRFEATRAQSEAMQKDIVIGRR